MHAVLNMYEKVCLDRTGISYWWGFIHKVTHYTILLDTLLENHLSSKYMSNWRRNITPKRAKSRNYVLIPYIALWCHFLKMNNAPCAITHEKKEP